MPRYEDEDQPRRRAPAATSGKAIGSLICGILSFCLPCLAAVPALALGFLGMKDINASRGRLTGKGMCLAGIITSLVGSLCSGTAWAIFGTIGGGTILALFGIGDAAAKVKSSNDLKQIGIALATYQETYGKLPASANRQKPGDPPHSWRVAILPFLEQESLYKSYHFNEAWDSPANKAVLENMPKIYTLPAAGKDAPANKTYWQMFVGKGTVGEGTTLTRISTANGTSQTLMVVEAAEPVPWTKPEDLPFSPTGPLPKLGGHHKGIFLALWADGSIGYLRQDADEKELRAAIDYTSNVPINKDRLMR